jgi:hypothetical protein
MVLSPENGHSRLICLHCRTLIAVGNKAREPLNNHNCVERKKTNVSAFFKGAPFIFVARFCEWLALVIETTARANLDVPALRQDPHRG